MKKPSRKSLVGWIAQVLEPKGALEHQARGDPRPRLESEQDALQRMKDDQPAQEC